MTGRANNQQTGFNENMNNRTVVLSLLIAMAALLVSLPWLRGEEPAEPSFDLEFPFWPSRDGQDTPIRGSGARSSSSSHDRCSVRSRLGR